MKKILLPIVAAFTLYSCSNSDDLIDEQELNLTEGYFITNEGQFNSNNATVSHINGNLSALTNNIFKSTNGKVLGDVAQSMAVTDKYVFVVVNNSNTIEVVNKKTFKSVYTITEQLNFPRFAVVKNGKLYVSLMNNAEVLVYNAETFAFVKSVALNYPAEQLVANNEYIYAANNFYSGGTLVELIDVSEDTNTVDVTLNAAINGLTASGETVYAMTNNETNSFIYALNGTTVSATTDLELANGRNLSVDGQSLYFTAETDVYKINSSLASTANKLFSVGSGNGYALTYGFNVFNGYIFTGNAGNFTDNGKVVIYKEDGSLVKEYTVGIAPNGFYKY